MPDSRRLSRASGIQSSAWNSAIQPPTTSTPGNFIPWLFTLPNGFVHNQQLRYYSHTTSRPSEERKATRLTHVSESGSAHMVSIADKEPSKRVAKAVCSVHFTNEVACRLIKENQIKKGDVLGVARVAGIMAAKRTPDLIPLCHPIVITKVNVDLGVFEDENGGGRVEIEATVACEGKTGVEMEALTAASTAALTVYDMCKAVDKSMSIQGLRVVLKEGGQSGRWVDGVQKNLIPDT